MAQQYNLTWLIDTLECGEEKEFFFFWGHSKPNSPDVTKACFSQWYQAAFKIEGVEYKTAEHWMMANKALLFEDEERFKQIIAAPTPADAKKLGRKVMGFDEIKWNAHRYNIVRLGNIHKFNQHPKLAEFLFNTGEKIIAEASPHDAIWGIGMLESNEYAGNVYSWGLNLLGFALMEVRDFLKEFGHFSDMQNAMPAPWQKYPGISPIDMFWRMGKGETYLKEFYSYLQSLGKRENAIYQLSHPSPPEWEVY